MQFLHYLLLILLILLIYLPFQVIMVHFNTIMLYYNLLILIYHQIHNIILISFHLNHPSVMNLTFLLAN